jgi:transposase-like protein
MRRSIPPTRCPNPACECHGAPPPARSAPFFWRKGAFVRRDRRRVARYQCRRCGRHFSAQTATPTWRRRRCDVDEPLLRLLRRGTSLRAAARLLGVNRKTVARRARDPRWKPPGPSSEPGGSELTPA